MKIQISDHQDKAEALRRALLNAGHEVVYTSPDIMLIDFDGPLAHYPRTIERAYEQGADIYLYSHGAMPLTCWDGIWTPSEQISGFFAQTPGQKAVMEAYNYPHPVHVIGWHYSEQRPFTPTDGKRVLFAPWHPQGTGWLLDEGKEANRRIYEQLLTMPIELTVRHVLSLDKNNLWEAEGVEYEQSNKMLGEAIKSILAHDLIVGYGTFAYLAIALGKPTVMFGQNCVPYDGYNPETLQYVKHWDTYRELMHYPHDVSRLSRHGFWFALKKACQEEATEWRRMFIGEQFDGAAFVALLEKLNRERVIA